MYRSVDDQTITKVVDISYDVVVVIVAGVSMSVPEERLNILPPMTYYKQRQCCTGVSYHVTLAVGKGVCSIAR